MAVAVVSKRKIQAEKTKRSISDSVKELIEENGLDNFTVQDIVQKINISVGAFYHHYKSKDEAVQELLYRIYEIFEEEAFCTNIERAVTAQEKIVLFFSRYAKFIKDSGVYYIRQILNYDNKMIFNIEHYLIRRIEAIIVSSSNNENGLIYFNPNIVANNLLIIARGFAFDWCMHNGSYNLELKMISCIKKIDYGLSIHS